MRGAVGIVAGAVGFGGLLTALADNHCPIRDPYSRDASPFGWPITPADWTWDDQDCWKEKYVLCDAGLPGSRQSPMDLYFNIPSGTYSGATARTLNRVTGTDGRLTVSVSEYMRTATIDGNFLSMTLEGRDLETVSAHVTAPALHKVKGVEMAAELMMFMRYKDQPDMANGGVIFSTLLDYGQEANPLFTALGFTDDASDSFEPRPSWEINAASFLRTLGSPAAFNRVYSYDGSIPVPPCTENIRWVFADLDRPFTVTQTQAQKLMNLLSDTTGGWHKREVAPSRVMRGRPVLANAVSFADRPRPAVCGSTDQASRSSSCWGCSAPMKSPINIDTSAADTSLEPFTFDSANDYLEVMKFNVTPAPASVDVVPADAPYDFGTLQLNGRVFVATKIMVRAVSQHSINGVRYPGEVVIEHVLYGDGHTVSTGAGHAASQGASDRRLQDHTDHAGHGDSHGDGNGDGHGADGGAHTSSHDGVSGHGDGNGDSHGDGHDAGAHTSSHDGVSGHGDGNGDSHGDGHDAGAHTSSHAEGSGQGEGQGDSHGAGAHTSSHDGLSGHGDGHGEGHGDGHEDSHGAGAHTSSHVEDPSSAQGSGHVDHGAEGHSYSASSGGQAPTGASHTSHGTDHAADSHHGEAHAGDAHSVQRVMVSFPLTIGQESVLLRKLGLGYAALRRSIRDGHSFQREEAIKSDVLASLTGNWYWYSGSTTDEECGPTTRWMIFETPTEVNFDQLNYLSLQVSGFDSARSIEPLLSETRPAERRVFQNSLPVFAFDTNERCEDVDRGHTWDYDNPRCWGDIPGDESCRAYNDPRGGGAEYGSPIDIRTDDVVEVGNDIVLEKTRWQPVTNLRVKNMGHNLQISNLLLGYLQFISPDTQMPDYYQVEQFHIHMPSEHLINGRQYPCELHVVHAKQDNVEQLNESDDIVTSFLFDIGEEDNELLKQFFLPNGVDAQGNVVEAPKHAHEEIELSTSVNLMRAFGPALDGSFYRYDGTTTSPPCAQIVKWFVFEKPMMMSLRQWHAFKEIYPSPATNRPVQPLNGRPIYKNMMKEGQLKQWRYYLNRREGHDFAEVNPDMILIPVFGTIILCGCVMFFMFVREDRQPKDQLFMGASTVGRSLYNRMDNRL